MQNKIENWGVARGVGLGVRFFLVVLVVALACRTVVAAGPPLEIVTASYFNSTADSDLQGTAAANDGTIYVVGNSSTASAGLPGGIPATRFGSDVKAPKCGRGFVAHLSPDGKHILHYAEFSCGTLILTTVQVSGNDVYISGYGAAELAGILKDRPGLIREFPLVEEIRIHHQEVASGKEDKIAGRPGLGRYGAPCVLRLSKDLATIQSGTYLEGWQQVWDKKRVSKQGSQMLGGYQEYFWQPTSLAVVKGGNLLVCHDGGYFRMANDKDRELAKDNPKLLDRLIFYDTCDYVSSLSPDLTQRLWKKPIYTPPVDPAVAKTVKDGWPLAHYSSPRTHRMRLDRDDNIYLCGWSASATSKEPWWSPYLYKLDPTTGDPIWKAYEYDPFSGGGNRLGGQVADTACVSLAVDEDGNVLSSLLADGGNSVMEWSPKAERLGESFEVKTRGGGFGVKLVHWWGQIHRFDSKTRQGLGGARIGPWGWAHDIASLPDNSVMAFGRYNWKFDFTPDAWCRESPVENPNAFLRVYSPTFDLEFSTALPGVVPFEICRVGTTRYVLVGRAEQGVSPVKNALFPKSPGKTSGYLLIVDWKGEVKK